MALVLLEETQLAMPCTFQVTRASYFPHKRRHTFGFELFGNVCISTLFRANHVVVRGLGEKAPSGGRAVTDVLSILGKLQSLSGFTRQIEAWSVSIPETRQEYAPFSHTFSYIEDVTISLLWEPYPTDDGVRMGEAGLHVNDFGGVSVFVSQAGGKTSFRRWKPCVGGPNIEALDFPWLRKKLRKRVLAHVEQLWKL